MIVLLIIIVLLIAGLAMVAYLLGFRLGSTNQQDEILRIRAEAIEAERRLYDATRDAYQAMVEHVDRTRRDRR